MYLNVPGGLRVDAPDAGVLVIELEGLVGSTGPGTDCFGSTA